MPLDARRSRGDVRPRSFYPFRPDDGEGGPALPDAPPILLIDAIERRIRSLGYDPVRTFDARHRWRLEAAGEVIAAGPSLAELARAAHAWLLAHEEGPR
ncbi:MAG TPA: hypothetical protein VF158_15100 [Longimicrobiales bacterium]